MKLGRRGGEVSCVDSAGWVLFPPVRSFCRLPPTVGSLRRVAGIFLHLAGTVQQQIVLVAGFGNVKKEKLRMEPTRCRRWVFL